MREADMPIFVTLTNKNPYRKGARVALASHAIVAIEETAWMQEANGVPDSLVALTFVYTTGGNQFQVLESFDQIADALVALPMTAVIPRRALNTLPVEGERDA